MDNNNESGTRKMINNSQSQHQLRCQEFESQSLKIIVSENNNYNHQQKKRYSEIIQEENDETSIRETSTDSNIITPISKLEDQILFKKIGIQQKLNEEKLSYQVQQTQQEEQRASQNLTEIKQDTNSLLSQLFVEANLNTLFDNKTNNKTKIYTQIQYQDLSNFEKGKDYLVYFPHNNFTKVLKKQEQLWRNKMLKVIKAKIKKQSAKKVSKIERSQRRSVFKQIQLQAISFTCQNNQISQA